MSSLPCRPKRLVDSPLLPTRVCETCLPPTVEDWLPMNESMVPYSVTDDCACAMPKLPTPAAMAKTVCLHAFFISSSCNEWIECGAFVPPPTASPLRVECAAGRVSCLPCDAGSECSTYLPVLQSFALLLAQAIWSNVAMSGKTLNVVRLLQTG